MFVSPRCGYTGSAVGRDHPSAPDGPVGPDAADGNGNCPLPGVFDGTGGFEQAESATHTATATIPARRPITFPTASNVFSFTRPTPVRSIGTRDRSRRTR